jgi:hypothetical protein
MWHDAGQASGIVSRVLAPCAGCGSTHTPYSSFKVDDRLKVIK